MEFTRCYGCMRELSVPGTVCPHCGYDNTYTSNDPVKQPIHKLPCGSMLGGRYIIGKSLGQGGFGITYIGWDNKLEIPVAIKEYYPNGYAYRDHNMTHMVTVTDKGASLFRDGKQKFLREAQILARFNAEPGIVSVHDFFEENNTAYIVMEYLDGVTLKSFVASRGGIPADVLFPMMKPLIKVLGKVHEQGIVHRDISPENIMFMCDKTLKLLDFGSAREVEEGKSLSVTLKPGYAPEEQYRSRGKQGPWTDIYALCATMYYSLTGVRPEESVERAMNPDSGLQLPSSLGAKITPAQENVILHGMAIRNNERYQSMRELEEALDKASEQGGEEKAAAVSFPELTVTVADDTEDSTSFIEKEPLLTNEPDIKNCENDITSTGQPSYALKRTSVTGTRQFESVKEPAVPKTKTWKSGKTIITLALCVVLGIGGAMYYRNWREEPTDTPVPIPVETSSKPSPTATVAPTLVPSSVSDAETTSAPKPDSSAVPTPTLTPAVKNTPAQAPTPSPEFSPVPTSAPTPAPTTEPTIIDKNGIVYALYTDHACLTKHYSQANYVDIPAVIEDRTVTEIGNDAFVSVQMTSVTIPDSITSIGSRAFYGCTSLKSVTIPNSVTHIGHKAFAFCPHLSSVTIPNSITSIESGMFSDCTNLSRVTIPDSVTDIGIMAFSGCTQLSYVVIPNSVVEIGSSAFFGCTSLKKVTISRNVLGIGDSAFSNCTNLQQITIPDTVTSISNGVFSGCTSLYSVTIPESITSIGNNAFFNCSSLKDIYYEGTETQWAAVSIGEGNDYFTGAIVHCNSPAEAEKELAYNEAEALLTKGDKIHAAIAFGKSGDYADARERSFALWRELVSGNAVISAGDTCTAAVRIDGTVVVVGNNEDSQCDVSDFKDIIAVSSGDLCTFALRADGFVTVAGWIDEKEYNDICGWTNIVAIEAKADSHIVGLCEDGTIVTTGSNQHGQCDVSDWTDIVAISARGYDTVGLRSDGTVLAVGFNNYGQCDVSDWTDIVAICAGGMHTVGLRADGTVVAVGSNNGGQCDVSGWTNIVAVAAGNHHTVGLRADGTVVATGAKKYGKYGQCDVSDWSSIVAISAGGYNTVGLCSDGTVIATGNNEFGQCNVSEWQDIRMSNNPVSLQMESTHDNESNINHEALFELYLRKHPEFEYGTWIDLNGDGICELLVSARDNQNGWIPATLCALSADGLHIFSWNLYSQYVPFTYDPKESAIVGDGGGTGVYERCVVQLGHDELIVRRIGRKSPAYMDKQFFYNAVERLPGGEDVTVGFRGGEDLTGQPDLDFLEPNAITEEAYNDLSTYYKELEVITFSPIESMQIWTPDPHSKPSSEPLQVYVSEPHATNTVLQVSAGTRHSAVLWADGRVSTVGDNGCGQCDTTTWRGIKKISAGVLHTVALDNNGRVYAAGYNVDGQCNVSSWTDIIDIATQHYHTIGLKSDGTVVATGTDAYGACDVSSLFGVVSISAGEYHNLGLTKDGRVLASGSNIYGESNVSDWSDVIAIDAGYNHSVALCKDGRVLACGKNTYGQCNTNSWANIKMLAAGGNHTVGLLEDGTVVAVGDNGSGQCNVWDWNDIVYIAAGYNTTLGIRSDGTIIATGWNEYGQCNVSSWNNTIRSTTETQQLKVSAYQGDLMGYSQILFKDATASSSFSENGYVYYPIYAIDQDDERPWVEGVKGDGIGEYLLLSFDQLESVDLLCIHPGFTSAYEKNNRPRKVEFSFSDGSSVSCELEDLNGSIFVAFNQSVKTRYIKITIQSVYSGRVPDTCIAEVSAYSLIR